MVVRTAAQTAAGWAGQSAGLMVVHLAGCLAGQWGPSLADLSVGWMAAPWGVNWAVLLVVELVDY